MWLCTDHIPFVSWNGREDIGGVGFVVRCFGRKQYLGCYWQSQRKSDSRWVCWGGDRVLPVPLLRKKKDSLILRNSLAMSRLIGDGDCCLMFRCMSKYRWINVIFGNRETSFSCSRPISLQVFWLLKDCISLESRWYLFCRILVKAEGVRTSNLPPHRKSLLESACFLASYWIAIEEFNHI